MSNYDILGTIETNNDLEEKEIKVRVRKVAVHIRKIVKLLVTMVIAAIFILGIIEISYKQTYSVSLNGEIIGYTNDKIALQKRINKYLESGNGDDVAFVELTDFPTYQICLLKKTEVTNDDEIFNKIVSSGISYYKYYAITVGDEEKAYVKTFDEAESVINQLKEKSSTNANSLNISEKYAKNSSTEGNENATVASDVTYSSVDDCVNQLYVAPVKVASSRGATRKKSTSAYQNIGKQVVSSTTYPTDLGVTLIEPVVGTISSRFGYRSRDNHKGLDIAAPKGTAIKAAAGGTVIFASNGSPYSGYGNCVVVQSNSSLIIIYGHCSKLYVTKGETVSQGQIIGAVGSTGYSTGNHLHFEIRYNGTAINPQKYVY